MHSLPIWLVFLLCWTLLTRPVNAFLPRFPWEGLSPSAWNMLFFHPQSWVILYSATASAYLGLEFVSGCDGLKMATNYFMFFPLRCHDHVSFPWTWAGSGLFWLIQNAEGTLCWFQSWGLRDRQLALLFSWSTHCLFPKPPYKKSDYPRRSYFLLLKKWQ